MDAEMIILCDGVVIPQSKKEIDGGVAIAGGHILRIGARAELSDYLGVDTEVVEYHNSTLFTFDRTNTEGDANIAVVAGNMKHHGHGDLKKTAFCTLWRSQMRFRAVALRSITAARF